MTWVKIDDQWPNHPKARAAGKNGRELAIASWCWSAANLTDGFIATHDLPLLAAQAEVPARPTARRLVEVGLWEEVEGGWLVHDYLDRNPTADKVLATREARSRSGAKGGRKSGESRRASKSEANASATGEAEGKQNRTPSPSPSGVVDPSTGSTAWGDSSADPGDAPDDRGSVLWAKRLARRVGGHVPLTAAQRETELLTAHRADPTLTDDALVAALEARRPA